MPVYVGVSMWPFGRMIMCHMFVAAPSQLDKLHQMADDVGLRRAWFQDREGLPHYDISKSVRKKAVALGAIPLDAIEDEARVLEIVMPRFRR